MHPRNTPPPPRRERTPLLPIMATIIILTTTSLLQAITPTANALCYTLDGSISNDLPCHSNGSSTTDVSVCCEEGFFCTSGLLCLPSKEKPDVLIRGTCTDKTWASPGCPRNRVANNPSGGEYVMLCGEDSNEYCCSQVNCCDDPKASRFTLDEQSIVATTGQTPPPPPPPPTTMTTTTTTTTGSSSAPTTSTTTTPAPSTGTETKTKTETGTGTSASRSGTRLPASTSSGNIGSGSESGSGSSSSRTTAIGAGVGVGVGVVLFGAAGWIFFWRRRKTRLGPLAEEQDSMKQGTGYSLVPPRLISEMHGEGKQISEMEG
ncbi:uncharacterized protein BDCG_07112 [Blastomyces dermatitidis ER-3]|uniref:Uncharacterized protein n=1 Tax=Ajellomyces dermatitidis (strain ER-3 / ATCC MYA-2586) TaxID=559297 RepID=A0ABP2F7F5_AJEDR|nr:uncharacterized protein BDCG_07112 [Blastomyces dermatitidis ER-3]EEQ91992.2 hypothetical protein BDCG_07112 [Blastomyces dermatitidis ER-3]